jgi:membrane protein implicated in regulation of membrane protease activity
MTARETLGLALLIAAAVAAPMAYFLGQPWGWLALGLAVVGLPFYLTARVSRKWGKDSDPKPDVGSELKGFPGHRVFRNSGRSGNDVDDE